MIFISRKLKFILISCLTISGLISLNAVQSSTYSWLSNDSIWYNSEITIYDKNTNSTSGFSEEDILYISEVKSLNFTSIDFLNQKYSAFYNGILLDVTNRSYAWNDFVEENFNPDSFLRPFFNWDYNTNTTILVDFFGHVNIPWIFLDPQWSKIDNQIDSTFNGSAIVDTVTNNFEPITYNITLNDLLEITNYYDFNGQTNINNTIIAFQEKSPKWTSTINLDNKVYKGIYNSTLGYDEYIPYTQYSESLEMEYFSDGQLSYYKKVRIKELQQNGLTNLDRYEYIVQYIENPTDNSSGFKWILVLPALILPITIIRLSEKNKEMIK